MAATRAGSATAGGVSANAIDWLGRQLQLFVRNYYGTDGKCDVLVRSPSTRGEREVTIGADTPLCNPVLVYLFILYGDLTKVPPIITSDRTGMVFSALDGLAFDIGGKLSGQEYIERVRSVLVNPPEQSSAAGYHTIPINLVGQVPSTTQIFITYVPSKPSAKVPSTPRISIITTIEITDKLRASFEELRTKVTGLTSSEQMRLSMMWSLTALLNTSFITLAHHCNLLNEQISSGSLKKKRAFGYEVIFMRGATQYSMNDYDPAFQSEITSIVFVQTIQERAGSPFDPEKPGRYISKMKESDDPMTASLALKIPGFSMIVDGRCEYHSILSLMNKVPAVEGAPSSASGIRLWEERSAQLQVDGRSESVALQFRGFVCFGLPYISVAPAPKEGLANFKLDNFGVQAFTNISDIKLVDSVDKWKMTSVVDVEAQSGKLAAQASVDASDFYL